MHGITLYSKLHLTFPVPSSLLLSVLPIHINFNCCCRNCCQFLDTSIIIIVIFLLINLVYIRNLICRRKKKCIRFMTGDPDADEHTDKDDEDDDLDDDIDNNNSLSARAAGSDSDDSSQAGYSSECGAGSLSTPLLHQDNNISASTSSHKHSIGGILGLSCPTRLTAHSSSIGHSSHSASNDTSTIPNSKSAIHAT